MNKLLLFSIDPGGANVLAPLAKSLRAKGYTIKLFGKNKALDRYKLFGLQGKNITKSTNGVEVSEMVRFLRKEKPSIVITSTSPDDYSERHLWQAASLLHIPSIGILDQWMNYGLRFSKYTFSDLKKYLNDKNMEHMPSKIFTMDEYAKKEMIREGIPKEKIVIVGHPYLEYLQQTKKVIFNKIEKKKQNMFKILFVSEYITEVFGKPKNSVLGYDEKTIVHELVKALKKISKTINKRVQLIIKLHPKDTLNKYNDIVRFYKKYFRITIKSGISDPWKILPNIDLVCGMRSIVLLEASLCKLPIMSIQIGLKTEDPFILSRQGLIKTIRNRDSLEKELKLAILGNKQPEVKFKFTSNSIARIIQNIELCLLKN